MKNITYPISNTSYSFFLKFCGVNLCGISMFVGDRSGSFANQKTMSMCNFHNH